MKYRITAALISILLIAFLLGAQTAKQLQQQKPSSQKPAPKKIMSYEKAWKQVDSLEALNLPKSTFAVLQDIYAKAKTENNTPEQIKSLIYILRYQNTLEENGEEKNYRWLKAEIVASKFPVKPIMQSILAQNLQEYYNNSSWEILQQTNLQQNTPDSLAHWNALDFEREIKNYYLQSISEKTKLQNEPVRKFEKALATEPGSDTLRPTLYDLLAHRALNYFTTGNINRTQAAAEENITQTQLLADTKAFSGTDIYALLPQLNKADSRITALNIYMDILAFHLADKNLAALVDADLARLRYAFDILTTEAKNDAYYNALLALEDRTQNNPAGAEAGFVRAQFVLDGYRPQNLDTTVSLPKLALRICEKYIAKYPESYGGKSCQFLKANILAKDFSTKTESSYLPQTAIKFRLEYKNISQVYYRILPVTADFYKRYKNSYSPDSSFFAELLKLNAIQQNTVSLLGADDYLQHATEIKADGLNYGTYALLVSADKDFKWEKNHLVWSAFSVTQLSATSQNRHLENKALLYIRDAKNGSPVKSAEVKIFKPVYDNEANVWKQNLVETKTTDKNGTIEIFPGKDYTNYTLEIRKGKDVLLVNDGLNVNQYFPQEQQQTRTFFFTDRSIYRPGQTVYFKAIRLQNNQENIAPKLVTDFSTTIQFRDVNGEVIAQKDFRTNEFGSYNGSFLIPSNLLSGNMSLADDAGEISIQVEEYKRPQFEVKLDTPKTTYRLNQKITQSGHAETYSGASLNNASVKYRVQRQANFPMWMWWKSYFVSADAEIANGTTQTDANGNFKFDFTALPDPKLSAKDKPEFSYTITVDVTSQSGETQSTTSVLRIGYTALQAEIMAADWLDNSVQQEINIQSTNLSGKEIKTSGNLKVEKLKEPETPLRNRLWQSPDKPILSKEEFKKHFPNDVYMDEDQVYNYPVEKTILNQNIQTQSPLKLDAKTLSGWPAGNYKISFTTKDTFGENVESIKYIKVYDPKAKKPAFTTYSYFIPYKTKNVQPGEKAVFLWGSAAKITAHIIAEHNGKIVLDKWIQSKGGQQKIEIPVTEAYRGGLYVTLTAFAENRLFQYTEAIDVPWPKRNLDISTAVWRNKTKPGAKETWTFTIKGPNAEKAAAEMLAGMYDASLDAFLPHSWSFDINPQLYNMIYENTLGFAEVSEGAAGYEDWNTYYGWNLNHGYDDFISFREYYNYYGSPGDVYDYYDTDSTVNVGEVQYGEGRGSGSGPGAPMKMRKDGYVANQEIQFVPPTVKDEANQQKPPMQIRKNKQETAFFYPELRTNENGEVSFEFTMPDALTRWKFMAFAHTKDLKYGQYGNTIITQKELMVQPNLPRFLRAGDEMEFSASVTNLSGEAQKGEVRIKLFDAYSMKYLGDEILANSGTANQNLNLQNGESKNISWKIKTPANVDAIMYQLIASTGKFSDGEEGVIPVLPNRMLVTETLPMYVNGNQTKSYNFNALINGKQSKTQSPYKLTLEITSNPAWFAVQALPYLMESPYENAEQVFNRFYANVLSQHIVKNNPQIKQVFESWKNTSALQSNLEKNEELKNLLLQETPWLAEGKNESERKQRIALLFDENNVKQSLENTISKLEQMQRADGGWPWFEGMETDRFITQYIVAGLGRIEKMNIQTDYLERLRAMMIKAVIYMDEQSLAEYNNLVKYNGKTLKENHISPAIIQYFYARSYFKYVPMQIKYQQAYVYWQQQGMKYWPTFNLNQKAMFAVAMNQIDNYSIADKMIAAIDELALHSDEMGMYWKENATSGYWWYQQPTVTQTLLIEAYSDISNKNYQVEEMKLWLLKQKQTQNWESSKATADAVYALLLTGKNPLISQKQVKVFLGGTLYDPNKNNIKPEAGTGYYKASWNAAEIKPEQGKIKLEKQDEGSAWGAAYYQYFEDINAIMGNSGSLSISKDLFIKQNTANGPVLKPISANQPLKTGDLVTVRIRIKSDRNMEYVHIKDMRAAALEPTETISGYTWNSNLGYYQAIKDASMNFFISYLPKGDYTFEYTLRASQAGTFTNGISQIQCFYAPEFSGQTGSIKLNIGK